MTNISTLYTTFETKTGLEIRVRYIEPDDAPFLVDIFEHMSSESRYRRFLQTLDHVSDTLVWREAERIANFHPDLAGGFIAFADVHDEVDVPIAAGRYVRFSQDLDVAETAVSVRDDLHGLGIGTELLKLVAEEARRAGVIQLVATIQNENKAIWGALKHLPYAIEKKTQGAYADVMIDLTSPLAEDEDNWHLVAEFTPQH